MQSQVSLEMGDLHTHKYIQTHTHTEVEEESQQESGRSLVMKVEERAMTKGMQLLQVERIEEYTGLDSVVLTSRIMKINAVESNSYNWTGKIVQLEECVCMHAYVHLCSVCEDACGCAYVCAETCILCVHVEARG